MSNLTHLHGLCPPPFLQESLFPEGGYVLGRFCAAMPEIAEGQSCCLPCPATDWIFPNNFYSLTRIAGYVSIVALALCLVMLLSFAILPAERTRRHYLNVCLVISIVLLQLGFIVPWAVRPAQCHNLITPNDLKTSMTCAWGGALMVCGGSAINMWILIRALSMHLQICWNLELGPRFFWSSQLVGWGITAILLSCELSLSGVSFRFGDYCHVNHQNSLATLWGPLLVISALSLITQLSTFGYCLRVYLKHALDERNETISTRSQLSNSSQSSSRAVYRRVRRVLALQWRGLAIASIVLIDTIFFSIVFVVLDGQTAEAIKDPTKFMPWLSCLAYQGKDKCLGIAKPLGMNEGVLIATLLLLSVAGIQAFVLLYRWEMFTSWILFLRGRKERRDFIPLNSRRFSCGPLDPRMRDTPKLGTTSTASLANAPPVYAQAKGAVTFVAPLSPTEKMKHMLQTSPTSFPAPNFSVPYPHSPNIQHRPSYTESDTRHFTRHETGRSWLNEDASSTGDV